MDKGFALEKLQSLVGRDLRQLADELGVTVWRNGLNKGWAGHTVERYLGLPRSAQSPNLGSWELKVAPLTRQTDGTCVVKETIAITMLDPAEVVAKPFEESHLFTKLRKIIAVSRIREDSGETRSICKTVHAFDLEETALYDDVAGDYEAIRKVIRESGVEALTANIGAYVQPRTKGPGHGSTSRAFYARKEFVEYIIGLKLSPRSTGVLVPTVPHALCTLARKTEPIESPWKTTWRVCLRISPVRADTGALTVLTNKATAKRLWMSHRRWKVFGVELGCLLVPSLLSGRPKHAEYGLGGNVVYATAGAVPGQQLCFHHLAQAPRRRLVADVREVPEVAVRDGPILTGDPQSNEPVEVAAQLRCECLFQPVELRPVQS